MTEVIIIRHGETEWNVARRYQGQLDSPLTARGLAQASAIAQRLAAESFDLLVSSDLKRAADTAAIIAEAHPGLAFECDSRLRERDFGILAGLTRAEALARYPQAEAGYLQGGPEYRIPNGESLRDLYERSAVALNEWNERMAGGRLLVVTHGGVLGQFLRYVTGIPLETKRAYKFVNCAYNSFLYQEGTWLLQTWGDTAHLAAMGSADDL